MNGVLNELQQPQPMKRDSVSNYTNGIIDDAIKQMLTQLMPRRILAQSKRYWLDPQRKHGTDKMTGPHTLTAVNDNGTVTLRKDTNGGAVHETWNIRNLEPCVA